MKGSSMSSDCRWSGFLLFLLLLPAASLSAPDADIIDRIFERQKELSSAVRDAIYVGNPIRRN